MDLKKQLEQILELLKIEKEEDLAQYKEKMKSTSFAQRSKKGVCWYPVQVERTNFNNTSKLILQVSRIKDQDNGHSFQSGKLVSVFSNTDNKENSQSINGVVNQVNKNTMTITLSCEEIPFWLNKGNIGVQLLFDENTYREMNRAALNILRNEDSRAWELCNIIYANARAGINDIDFQRLEQLNPSQNQALKLSLAAKDVAIIHGPPGTGKTTTIVQSILACLKTEQQVLVCTPSNASLDLLVEKLSLEGKQVVRIGHPARVTQESLDKTLDAQITQHPHYKELKNLKKKTAECFKLAAKYKRNFGNSQREKRKFLFDQAHSLKNEVEQLNYYITNSILANADIIASTLVGSSNYHINKMRFSTLFIDEAAQALEPACFIPLLKADKVIFAGDHQQLPPTIKSMKASKNGLSITLFEKAINNHKPSIMLKEQYRMNEKIMKFSSDYFYDSLLFANINNKDWTILKDDMPIEFIDTSGCSFNEEQKEEDTSLFNSQEAYLLQKHFTDYILKIDKEDSLNNIENIGIIAPYKAQTKYIQNILSENIPDEIMDKVSVNTVDSFQGQERDIIYISMTRSNSKGEIGFLKNTRRMNVALTRARKKLVIIGDSSCIGQHEFYSKLIDYITDLGAYRSAFELQD